jgi:hypothetical protein
MKPASGFRVLAFLFIGLSVNSCGRGDFFSPNQSLRTPVSPTGMATALVPGGLTITCTNETLAIGIDGTAIVECIVGADTVDPIDVTVSCGEVAGVSCSVEPAVVTVAPDAPAPVTATVTYSEASPFGVSPLYVSAALDENVASATLLLTKDMETMSASCPSAASIAVTDRDFQLQFEGDPTGGRPSDCPVAQTGRPLTDLQANVYRALAVLRQLQFDTPLPFTGMPPYEWMRTSIRGMRFRTDIPTSSCCRPDGFINISVGAQSGFVFTPPGVSPFRNVASAMALFVHEARHNNGKLHTCGDNDQTVHELGAWGAQYYFRRWILDHTPPGVVPDEVRPRLEVDTRGLCSRFCQGGCGV